MIEQAMYPLGPGLKEKRGKGKKLFPLVDRPDVTATIVLKKPFCRKCKEECKKK